MNLPEPIPISEGEDPPSHRLISRTIDVNGRKEHESIIRDPKKCEELGVDSYYEHVVYLARWGGYLEE